MKKSKTVRLGAVRLKVVEVDEILLALDSLKVMRHLDGRQRQHLEDAREVLAKARERPVEEYVEITVDAAVLVLKCIGMMQQWYQAMFDEFGGVDVN